ncbi:MAG: peptide chain release factor N(5)-glutamine methyltransferase [Ardenticatenaceae bacterium]
MSQLDLSTARQSLYDLFAWGIGELREGAIPTARLDAELLLGEVLGFSRAQLLARLDRMIPRSQSQHFVGLIERRKRREPVAYILGKQDFYGREFVVDHRVLIPRPETEELVERALNALGGSTSIPPALRQAQEPHREGSRVADIGTGSGAIAVTLAAQMPTLHLAAVDISRGALEVARENALRHRVEERIDFYEGSLLEPLFGLSPFDLIVANLPYVGTNEMDIVEPDVKKYEPYDALFAGPEGLDLFTPFFQQLSTQPLLRPGGVVLLEIGYAQGPPLLQLARSYFPRARKIALHKDLAHHDRFLEIRD